MLYIAGNGHTTRSLCNNCTHEPQDISPLLLYWKTTASYPDSRRTRGIQTGALPWRAAGGRIPT